MWHSLQFYPVESEEVKRVSTILNSIYNEKVRASKPKNKKKTGGKAKLNVGQGTIAVSNSIHTVFVKLLLMNIESEFLNMK